MNLGQTVYTATQLYVSVLLLGSLVTVAWAFGIFNRGNVQVAGIWFGVSGFGVLVLITIVLIHLTRE